MSLWPSLQVSKRLLRLFFCFSTPLPLLLCFKYSIFLLPFPSSLGFHAFLYHLNIGFFLLLPGNALLSLLRFLLWVLVPFPHLSVLQLDCLCNTSRQKINLPTNQRGYDTFETTVGKLSARRIQICEVYFSVIIF